MAIFLDLSKAFDTINHHIFLEKLEFYGIRGISLKWFKNYLSLRKQFEYKGTKSKLCEITYGVPQGSILGPLLTLFADNTNITYKSKNLANMSESINPELLQTIIAVQNKQIIT